MTNFYTSILFMLVLLTNAYGQYDVTFTITDNNTALPIENVEVFLDGTTLYTNSAGQVMFTGLGNGTYQYNYLAQCYVAGVGSLTLSDANASENVSMSASTTNDVFFFVGSPLTFNGAFVELYGDGFYQSLTTGSGGPFSSDILSDVPFGDYQYTITTPCYETVTGTVTVDCNDGLGSVVEANPAPATTNDVFFFVGSPLTINGAFVELYGDGFYQSLTTGSGGPFSSDILSDVPFGDYQYTITTPCYETVTGTVTVDCNGGLGSVVEANPAPATTNDVFFFVGSPLTINGAFVELYGDGFYQSLTTGSGGPFSSDILSDVPFGDYQYTITTPCYETVTGTVTVDCNGGLGSVVEANPAPATTNDVFFFIGEPLTLSGLTITLTDGADFNQTLVTGEPFGDIVSAVPFGVYSYTIEGNCYETLTGTVTVDCNEGNGALVAENPTAIVIDNSVSQDANVLTATASGYSYQWVDCDNENSEIDGETDQSFTATVDGNYAVIISSENCSTTSECTSVVGTGISNRQPALDIVVYPNPFTGNLNIQIQSAGEKTIVKVMTITGEIIMNENFTNEELININMSDIASGTYILQVSNPNGHYATPIVKL